MKFILEFIPLKIAIFIMGLLPRSIALKIGKGAGSLACWIMKSRYRVARQNILASWPETTEEDVHRIVTGCWQNLGQLAAEIANLPSLTK